MMKKVLLFLMVFVMAGSFIGCSGHEIERGKWENGVYYNKYGNFSISTNSYFTVYTDEKIEKELGGVYNENGTLCDMLISSDYCSVSVTVEKTSDQYTQAQYVDGFITNSKNVASQKYFEIGSTGDFTIAGRIYTCVPIRYLFDYGEEKYNYYEYNFINKTDYPGVFVVLRISAGSEADVSVALGLIKEIKK